MNWFTIVTMQNRIKQIIDNENLTYSKFADILDIQRSSISHIVNGRNKASLEVIQKILESFDYIEPNWLLFGKGSLNKIEMEQNKKNLFSSIDDNILDNEAFIDKNERIKPISSENIINSTDENKIEPSTGVNSIQKKIERIIIFYTDKSFTEYSPEKL